jgi:hypothetical protein
MVIVRMVDVRGRCCPVEPVQDGVYHSSTEVGSRVDEEVRQEIPERLRCRIYQHYERRGPLIEAWSTENEWDSLQKFEKIQVKIKHGCGGAIGVP